MRAFALTFITTVLLNSFAALAAETPAEPILLTQAHAHNDYAHARPLFDALDQGFCSVEAYIFLLD